MEEQNMQQNTYTNPQMQQSQQPNMGMPQQPNMGMPQQPNMGMPQMQQNAGNWQQPQMNMQPQYGSVYPNMGMPPQKPPKKNHSFLWGGLLGGAAFGVCFGLIFGFIVSGALGRVTEAVERQGDHRTSDAGEIREDPEDGSTWEYEDGFNLGDMIPFLFGQGGEDQEGVWEQPDGSGNVPAPSQGKTGDAESSEDAVIGVTCRDVDENMQSSFGYPEGAYLNGIVNDSPAQKVGLQIGQIVTKVDGKEIKSAEDLVKTIRSYQPGDQITLTVATADSGSFTEEDLKVNLVRRGDLQG